METAGIDIINKFIIQVVLVTPISAIVSKLKNREYRDCDISWLNSKMEAFTLLACETLHLYICLSENDATTMNDYTTNQYVDRFTVLLGYFKEYLN